MSSGIMWKETHNVGKATLVGPQPTFMTGTAWASGEASEPTWGQCYGFREDVDSQILEQYRKKDPVLFKELGSRHNDLVPEAWKTIQQYREKACLYFRENRLKFLEPESKQKLKDDPFTQELKTQGWGDWASTFYGCINAVTGQKAMASHLENDEKMRKMWEETI